MNEHKHASVLRAIADGVPLSEFETSMNKVYWGPLGGYVFSSLEDESIVIRRKPQYIMVNGFKVPKPLDALPSDLKVYGAAPTSISFYATADTKYEWWARLMISRGALHATPEAAIAHAKAMLGIDPKWEE